MKNLKFFNVKVHSLTLVEASLALEDKQIIFTPNPEILLEARVNKDLRRALKNGSLLLPDGHGLQLVSTLLKIKSKFLRILAYFPALFIFLIYKKPFRKEIPELIHGSDFMSVVLAWAELNEKSVYFLGGKNDVAEKTAKYFKSTHKDLVIAGHSSLDPGEEAFKEVRRSNAEIVFVAYGAPNQELWISKYAKKLPELHIIMGVGGSFDFWSGSVKRAPKWMRSLGLEWFYRLTIDPKRRITRIWNALFVFPLTCLSS